MWWTRSGRSQQRSCPNLQSPLTSVGPSWGEPPSGQLGLKASKNTPLTISSPHSRPGPALPRPSSTSQPRTLHSSASAAVTLLRSWSAQTPTGGGASPAGVLASSREATSSRCICDLAGCRQSQQPLQPRGLFTETEVQRNDSDTLTPGHTGLSGKTCTELGLLIALCLFIQTGTGSQHPRTNHCA